MAKLYVCPTPIGNLEDITLRTIRILEEADIVAAEDTRHTLKLLRHLGLQKYLVSLHEHNETQKSDKILDRLEEGHCVALVSDAGMPGISDPGEILIRRAIERGLPVEVLPGPAAFVTALVGSGLPTGRFYFVGFLDRSAKLRRRTLEELRYFPHTLIFYESPHRIAETVKDMAELLGDRKITLARELTKRYEEYLRASLFALREDARLDELRGEMVLIVEGSSEQPLADEVPDLSQQMKDLLEDGMSVKDAAKHLAERFGRKKKELYEIGLEVKKEIKLTNLFK